MKTIEDDGGRRSTERRGGAKTLLVVCSMFLCSLPLFGQDGASWEYLGLKRPGANPEVFAPGVVSTEKHEHGSPTFSPDLKEIHWPVFTNLEPGSLKQEIYCVRYEKGSWTKPSPAPFSGKHSDGGPCFSPDGKRLFFYSERPQPGGTAAVDDLYYMDRKGSDFSLPVPLGFTRLSKREKWIFSPSVTADGTLYLTGPSGTGSENPVGIFKALPAARGYTDPAPLGAEINGRSEYNWTSFAAPDDSYLLFSSKRPGNYGFNDLYISFKQDGAWSAPLNMGGAINNGRQVRFPSVSPDGKYLFFTRQNGARRDDVFWMGASIIDELRKQARE